MTRCSQRKFVRGMVSKLKLKINFLILLINSAIFFAIEVDEVVVSMGKDYR